MNRRWLAVVSGLIVRADGGHGVEPVVLSTAIARRAHVRVAAGLVRAARKNRRPNDSSGAAHVLRRRQQHSANAEPLTNSTGNFLGRRTSQPQPNTAPRVASRQRVGSAETSSNGSSTSGFTLPGLGGSRLPSTAGNSTQQTQSPSESPSNRGVGTRHGTPNSSTITSAQSSQPTARRSPQNRMALNVDPKT